jgi:hypothetical protein
MTGITWKAYPQMTQINPDEILFYLRSSATSADQKQ